MDIQFKPDKHLYILRYNIFVNHSNQLCNVSLFLLSLWIFLWMFLKVPIFQLIKSRPDKVHSPKRAFLLPSWQVHFVIGIYTLGLREIFSGSAQSYDWQKCLWQYPLVLIPVFHLSSTSLPLPPSADSRGFVDVKHCHATETHMYTLVFS